MTLSPALGEAFVDLMARIAHDLNNHLATILGKAEIAMMVDDPARWKRGVEEGYRAGQKARVLVADYQRLHGWYMRESPDPVPVHDILALVARTLERLATRASATIELGAAPACRVVEAAELGLGMWSIVADALERGQGNVGTAWTLTGEDDGDGHGFKIELRHPRVSWDDAARAIASGRVPADATTSRLARGAHLLRDAGATLTLAGERFEAHFSAR